MDLGTALILIFFLFVNLTIFFFGVIGLIYGRAYVPGSGFFRKPAPFHKGQNYGGVDSIAPSVAMIFVSLLFPLVMLSAYINRWLSIDYSMPILLGIATIMALFSIIYLRSKAKKQVK